MSKILNDYIDLKKIFTPDLFRIINTILDKTQNRYYKNNIDHMLGLIVEDFYGIKESFLITDKHYIYKSLWKLVIDSLYDFYLPEYNYEFTWHIETTPYSFFLWLSSGQEKNERDVELLQEKYNINNSILESDLDKIIEKFSPESNQIIIKAIQMIPVSLRPQKNKEILGLIFNIINIPPLEELFIFFDRYQKKIGMELMELNGILNPKFSETLNLISIPPILNNGFYYIDHHLLQGIGWDKTFENEYFKNHRDEISKIEIDSDKYEGKLNDTFICPCCGELSDVKIPKDAVRIKLLCENKELHKIVGLFYFEQYVSSFMENIIEEINNFEKTINSANKPDCLILVEGESEEIFIPIIALRADINLKSKKIKVYNCKSKQKVLSDFLSFKEKYPDLKMVCLLDSDAVKEKEEIQRIITDKLDKYRLIYIEHGAFEDLFDLETSLTVLNALHPNGEDIIKDDIEQSKDFARSISKVLFLKKKEKFDKVKFAKMMAFKLSIDKIPHEIKDVFDKALLLCSKSKYI